MAKKALRKNKDSETRVVRTHFKKLREGKGTQRYVAEQVGVTEVTVRHVENGWLDPGFKLIVAFTIYFNETAEKLFPDLFIRNGRNVI
ncbi:helix-turn-helix transcriptional regulator [Paenibacillus alvei]|uniref:helix-turn-helix transcriptional regulator n=1 Tax=Paenibacillus alvei TaxID=44250 RepID=UPI0013DC6B09|nr:helix-turn-helix transcriptional regulator [Paenibacillus alvei]NEZ44644.1 helix-turn-helix domain-containing protein [Paenibacillus alvei]